MASSERFGYAWDKYWRMTEVYEGQLRNWVHPLSESDFKGQRILDVGCGMGRNSYWTLTWGARDVTALDLDPRTVARAEELLKRFPNAAVVQKSVYAMDWEEQFDIAMSIGVIHHLEDPKKALQLMVRSLKPGGTILIWVYSREGNEWIVRYVDPVRKNITSRLPLSVVHILSYFCSVPLWLFVKIFRGPTQYLRQLSSFDLWHINSIVFDQLLPAVANYWSKEQISGLFGDLGLKKYGIYRPPNEMGWTVIGVK
jgi:SAM-dependent methyltransferase